MAFYRYKCNKCNEHFHRVCSIKAYTDDREFDCPTCLVKTERVIEAPMLAADETLSTLRATDGTDISSRTKRAKYMRDNNLAMADDFKETWAAAQSQRAKHFLDGSDDKKARRDEISRVVYQNL
jgi:putative FmdB family regulatory protein